MAALLALSSCFLSKKAQSGYITGRYRTTTDFSRDIQTMHGSTRTVVYKNGRRETLQFKADHKFIRIIKFSTERVPDKKHTGTWKLTGYHQIQVLLKPATGRNKTQRTTQNIIENYRYEPSTRQMIRLGPGRKKLNTEWAPYYTFNRL